MLCENDIEELKQRISIGQEVEVQSSDMLWTDKKKKLIGTVIGIYKHFVECQFPSGIIECFTYAQILLNDGVCLQGKGDYHGKNR